MADIQRENERKERKNAKRRKKVKIIWGIIIAVIAIILVLKISEINFSALFNNESSGYSSSLTEEEGFPYKIDSGENTVLTVVGSKLAVLNDSSYTVLNPSDASEIINDEHGYANALIRTSGGYSVIYDQGSNVYRLDNQSENIYENSTEESILCADVADTGTVAMATVSGIHKSRISVTSMGFSEKMNYEVSGGYVTSIAIDDRGKNVAFAVTGSDNAEIKTTVYTMSVNDTQPIASFVYVGSSVLDLHFSSNYIYVVGNDFVRVISSLEKDNVVFENGSINTIAYCYNSADYLIIAYSQYQGAVNGTLAYIKQNGKVKTTVEVDGEIKAVCASGSTMTALTGNSAVTYKLRNGKENGYVKTDDSYTDIEQLSSRIYAKHYSYIEILND